MGAVKSGHNSDSIIDPNRTNNKLYTDKNPLNVKDFSSKIKLLEDINCYARNFDSKVKQVSVNLSGSWQKIDILRPSGQELSDIRPLVRLNISITLEDKG